jgi:hypothetical protein
MTTVIIATTDDVIRLGKKKLVGCGRRIFPYRFPKILGTGGKGHGGNRDRTKEGLANFRVRWLLKPLADFESSPSMLLTKNLGEREF